MVDNHLSLILVVGWRLIGVVHSRLDFIPFIPIELSTIGQIPRSDMNILSLSLSLSLSLANVLYYRGSC